MQTLGYEDAPDTVPAPPAEADAEILAATARRDTETAARLLVTTYGPALGRACMALLGSQSEAEAALRETLKEALGALPVPGAQRSLRGWLFGIARRRCARRSVERAAAPTTETAERAAEPGRARRLLAELKPTEREALVLRCGAELDFDDVGGACGVDAAAARQRVSRGLTHLRGLMREDDHE